MFIEYNANPYGKKIDDCMIRAITKATGKDYFDVMDGLIAVADDRDWEIDELRTGITYLDSIGWEFLEPSQRITVNQFSKVVTEPRIVFVREHATYTEGGNIYDTWNPARYKVKYMCAKRIDK